MHEYGFASRLALAMRKGKERVKFATFGGIRLALIDGVKYRWHPNHARWVKYE